MSRPVLCSGSRGTARDGAGIHRTGPGLRAKQWGDAGGGGGGCAEQGFPAGQEGQATAVGAGEVLRDNSQLDTQVL